MEPKFKTTYLGVQGTGDTLRLARADAAQIIENTIETLITRDPLIIRVGAHAALVTVTLGGWGMGYISQIARVCVTGSTSREEAICRAIGHIATMDVDPSNTAADLSDYVETCVTQAVSLGVPKMRAERLRETMIEMLLWQHRYAELAATGLTDCEIRAQL